MAPTFKARSPRVYGNRFRLTRYADNVQFQRQEADRAQANADRTMSADEFNNCLSIRSTGANAITLDPSDVTTGVYNLYATAERMQ